jgi:hypothetical protein
VIPKNAAETVINQMVGHEYDRGDGQGKDVDEFCRGHGLDKRLTKKRRVHRGQDCHITAAVKAPVNSKQANMLVATAVRGSMPNWNITGTVISDVPPVITLMELGPLFAGE